MRVVSHLNISCTEAMPHTCLLHVTLDSYLALGDRYCARDDIHYTKCSVYTLYVILATVVYTTQTSSGYIISLTRCVV